MTPERKVVDQDVRDRVTSDLGTTFLLEAGAGTGKTRVLVDRYVRCVLDPERGSGDVRTVAAITFTEKAAGELRQRVREEFEARAAGAAAGSAEAEAIDRALDALDDAPISTIHGFAGRLLREFPVEAGVDPAFEQLDGLGSDLERARLWEEWLAALAAGRPSKRRRTRRRRAPGSRRGASRACCAPACGWTRSRSSPSAPRACSASATTSTRRRSLPDEPELARGAGRAGARRSARLREYCRAACVDRSDKGFAAAMDLVEAVERLLAAPPADVDQLAAGLYALPAKDEQDRPRRHQRATGTPPSAARRNCRRATRRWSPASSAPRELYAEYVTGLAVAVADSFARWAGAAQVGLGRLDFTDLLGCLRDLLAATAVARRARCRPASATSSSTSSRTPTRSRPRSPSSSASASRAPPTGATWCSSPASSSWSATPSSPSTASAAPTSRSTTR